MSKLIVVICVLAFAGYKLKPMLFPAKAPTIDVVDANGKHVQMGESLKRPMVLGFWINQCGYSDRMLRIMNRMRTMFKKDDLDVVGFYVNEIARSDLKQSQKEKKLAFPVAAAQQNIDVIASLHESFVIRGAGVDLYVVDRRGKISTVAADQKGGAAEAAIEADLIELIEKKTGLRALKK